MNLTKIFFVAPISLQRPHGVSVYSLELIKGLLKSGKCKIGLLTISPEEKPLDSYKDLAGCLTMEGPKNYHWNPWFLNSVWMNKIKEKFGQPDFVHFHGLYEPFEAALASLAKHHGWNYIVSSHGGFHPCAQARKPFKKAIGNVLFSNKFIRDATAIHVLNDQERAAVTKRFRNSQIFNLPNGVNDDFFQAPVVGPATKKEGLTFGFIGRIDIKNKGIDLLLEAIIKLQRIRDVAKIKFIFAGPFHSQNDENIFKTYLKKMQYPQMVMHHGVVLEDKKQQFMDSFDVFLYTSRHEGMPGAVLEAMARAVPCLVTPGTNMQSIIKESEGGWVCDCSAESIFDSLCHIIDSSAEIPHKGEKAKYFIGDNFLWSKISERYLSQISRLK